MPAGSGIDRALAIGGMWAAGAVEALLQIAAMGVDRVSFTQALLAVLERITVGQLCPSCRVGRTPAEDEARDLSLPASAKVHEPGRCEACGDEFQGRRTLLSVWRTDALFRWDAANPLSLRCPRGSARRRCAYRSDTTPVAGHGGPIA